MQTTSPNTTTPGDVEQEALKRRARLNELPALISAAEERQDKEASRLLRTEKGHLDEYVPVLEFQARLLPLEARQTQIAQTEQELSDAETTLRVATELSHAANQCFALQNPNLDATQASVVQQAQLSATIEMNTARDALEALRLKLARLKADPEADLLPEEKEKADR